MKADYDLMNTDEGVCMYAERVMLETDRAGGVKRMPRLPPNKQFEAIFLVIDAPVAGQGVQRHPHVDIAGKMRLLGDVMSSAPRSDWDLFFLPVLTG